MIRTIALMINIIGLALIEEINVFENSFKKLFSYTICSEVITKLLFVENQYTFFSSTKSNLMCAILISFRSLDRSDNKSILIFTS
ncbi:hypothetical protein D3C73_1509640 [compost metagenome]